MEVAPSLPPPIDVSSRAPGLEARRSAAAEHCEAGELVYVDDRGPGITRRPWRGGFRYYDPRGERIVDRDVIRRLDALAIPPAYTDVWICPDPAGHIQATGRDARGRKQYRYHERWHSVRDADKYGQLAAFARALPRIRRRIAAGLAQPGLGREKVMAVVLRLLETTLIRIGTPEYARLNKSFGLTTLQRRHAIVSARGIRLRFRGKSGVEHDVTVADPRIARVVRRCMEIPGQTLFHYLDEDGVPHAIGSDSVNAYLREAGGGDFTAKHYRTWYGSVLAMAALQRLPWESEAKARKTVVEVVKAVARRLGNTPAVCRASYIHPRIIDSYLAGGLAPVGRVDTPRGLNADERRLLHFLESEQLPAPADKAA
ncbi:DNA topoisomerase IB [Pigmentiphaga soli]|uniref:DNA topoisomerase n=1 Tax=Pigmentiphaga soli TaxID=1007095 RepID=A0ABP8GVF4_9BURK